MPVLLVCQSFTLPPSIPALLSFTVQGCQSSWFVSPLLCHQVFQPYYPFLSKIASPLGLSVLYSATKYSSPIILTVQGSQSFWFVSPILSHQVFQSYYPLLYKTVCPPGLSVLYSPSKYSSPIILTVQDSQSSWFVSPLLSHKVFQSYILYCTRLPVLLACQSYTLTKYSSPIILYKAASLPGLSVLYSPIKYSSPIILYCTRLPVLLVCQSFTLPPSIPALLSFTVQGCQSS